MTLRNFFKVLLITLFFLAFSLSVQAATTYTIKHNDTASYDSTVDMLEAHYGSIRWTTSSTYNASVIEIPLRAGSGTFSAGTVQGFIYNTSGSLPTGSPLATSTSNLSLIGLTTTPVYFNFTFDSGNEVYNSNNYAVVVKGNGFSGASVLAISIDVNAANRNPTGRNTGSWALYGTNPDTHVRIWQAVTTPEANFSVTAQDYYNGSSILSFNATINGTNYTTTNGTINTGIPLNSGLVNITLYANNYFDRTYVDWDTVAGLNATMHKVEVEIQAYNGLTGALITDFNASNEYFFYVSNNGSIYANLTEGNIAFSFNASGYEQLNTTLAFTRLENGTRNVTLNPLITSNIYNESDGSLFFVNEADEVKLNIFCTNQTLEYTITGNVSNFAGVCAWDFMRLSATFGNDTYYRTLRPEINSSSIDWYMIDLNIETAVQKQFYLNDLAANFGDGDMIIEKIIGTSQVVIHRESWDIENKVQAYMILNDQYIVSVTNNENETRLLGPFLADLTGTHTITVPTIPFTPEQEIDDFKYSYQFNENQGWLFLQYESTAGLLSSVNWLIVNASNTSQVFLNSTMTTDTGSANYTSIVNNTGYKTILTFTHSSFSTHTDTKLWGVIELVDGAFSGFDDEAGFKKWLAVIIIVLFGLMFSGLTIGAGMTVMAGMSWLFYALKWLDFSIGIVPSSVIIGLFSVIAAIALFKSEGVQ